MSLISVLIGVINLLVGGVFVFVIDYIKRKSTKKEAQFVKSKLTKVENELSVKEDKIVNLENDSKAIKQQLLDVKTQSEKKLTDLQTKILEQEKKNNFVTKIINTQPEENEAVLQFKSLLSKDYMNYADSNNSLAEEARAFLKLQNVERELEFLGRDTLLLNKNIIAIAGRFSSGKSSFVNSFFKSKNVKLPVGLEPTTAISSYVISGEEPEITANTWKGGKIFITDTDILKSISHKEMKEYKFNLKELIDHFIFKTPFLIDLTNLCLIDTPGFNPGDGTDTDNETAINSITTADALFWCIGLKGNIETSDGLDILSEICSRKPELKVYIVLTQADLKTLGEQEDAISQIEEDLIDRGIPFEGISLYCTKDNPLVKYSIINQPKEYSALLRGKSIEEFLNIYSKSNTEKEDALKDVIKKVFDDYISADKARIKKYKRMLKSLNLIDAIFSDAINNLDSEVAFYKGRVDKKWKINPNRVSYNADEQEDNLSESLEEIKIQYSSVISQDNADIEKAEELCKKMQDCVSKVFGYYNK